MASLYHFTSVENLSLIAQVGALCSKQTLEDQGRWPCAEPGGDDLSHRLDRSNDNWDKVALSYTPRTPMAYRRKPLRHLCFFVVRLDAACLDGVIFTDTNAAATSRAVRRGEGLAGLDVVDFAAIKSQPRPWDREGWVNPVQAEVLIPDCVPLDLVERVVFVSMASLEEGRRLWGANPSPAFIVDRPTFADMRDELNFSYLETVLLTEAAVTKDNCEARRVHRDRFARRGLQRVTAVASVSVAAAGTKVAASWDGAPPSAYELETPNTWIIWPSADPGVLGRGSHELEVRINGIRWATVPFIVD